MSWASNIAGSISTPNQSSRGGRKVTGWIVHHNAATGGRGVLEMMRTGSKQVSANYQVLQNGDVWGVVPRENRSWSASNAAWDGSSLTFEIANDSGAPGWTISERAYHEVAKTIAEDADWAGIEINRTTVRGHREGSAQGAGDSYSTACPGGIDLDRLVKLANEYRSGAGGIDKDAEAKAAAEAAARIRKLRLNVALPLIAQQEVEGPTYGVNVAVWDSGQYQIIDGAQRDVWIDAGAAFLPCRNPGRFEYVVQNALERQATTRSVARDVVSAALDELRRAYGALEDKPVVGV